jgi:uncharacterized membrane protein YphA (DoxX/SURF4 family)
MRCPYTAYKQLDKSVTEWIVRHGVTLLRVSLGAIFLWFGLLKFFAGLSPAGSLAARTIELITFGAAPPSVGIPALALLECVIGVGLIANLFMRATLLLLFVQMICTAAAIFLFPDEVFTLSPYAPPLEGQDLIQNVALAAAALVTGSIVRGGRVVPNLGDMSAPTAHKRRSRVDRMRAPFPPEVLAFLLLGGGAVSSSVTGDCFEPDRRGERAVTLRDAGPGQRPDGRLPGQPGKSGVNTLGR